MKTTASVRVGATCVALMGFASSVEAADVAIETYTSISTGFATVPGIVSGGEITFSGSVARNSLSFTPGSVTFEGIPIDFSGTEASFLAASLSGIGTIPDATFPAIVPVAISGVESIAGQPPFPGTGTIDAVPLAPGFTAFNPIVDLHAGLTVHDPAPWVFDFPSGLQGKTTFAEATYDMVSLDALSWISQWVETGTIYGREDSGGGGTSAPTFVPWVLALLALTIIVVGAASIARRQDDAARS